MSLAIVTVNTQNFLKIGSAVSGEFATKFLRNDFYLPAAQVLTRTHVIKM